MSKGDLDGLNEWLENLRAALAEDYGIFTYSINDLKTNFSRRYYDGCTIYQALRKEFGDPDFR